MPNRLAVVLAAALVLVGCGAGGPTRDERLQLENDVAEARLDLATFCLSGGPKGAHGVRLLEQAYRKYGGDEKVDGERLAVIIDDEITELEDCSGPYARRLERLRTE